MLTLDQVKKYNSQMKNNFRFAAGCYADDKKAKCVVPLDPERENILIAYIYWQKGGYNWRKNCDDPNKLILNIQKFTRSGECYTGHGLGKFFTLKDTTGRMMFSEVIKATADFSTDRIKAIYQANKLDLDNVYRENGGANGIFEELARLAVMVEA